MKDLSVVLVFNAAGDRILLCERTREPYKGRIDFVGGKCETNEVGMDCAYRELYEETGIAREDIALEHVMDFAYHTTQWCVQVYAGRLSRPVTLAQEINPLFWSGLEEDFFDTVRYAGEGYMGHVLAHLRLQKGSVPAEE